MFVYSFHESSQQVCFFWLIILLISSSLFKCRKDSRVYKCMRSSLRVSYFTHLSYLHFLLSHFSLTGFLLFHVSCNFFNHKDSSFSFVNRFFLPIPTPFLGLTNYLSLLATSNGVKRCFESNLQLRRHRATMRKCKRQNTGCTLPYTLYGSEVPMWIRCSFSSKPQNYNMHYILT